MNINMTPSVWQLIIVLFIFSPLILGLIFMGPQRGVNLKHSNSGVNKSGYTGYCWTYFSLGFLYQYLEERF